MQDRLQPIRERVAYYWPTYGPPVLGAILVLLALFVGYRILSNRNSSAPTPPSVQDSNLSFNVQGTPTPNEPSSTVTVPPSNATPTPTIPVLGGTNVTKGGLSEGSKSATPTAGKNLPETGFPVVFALPGFVATLAGGTKLFKYKKA